MLKRPLQLEAHCPSPTTVSYTVSNALPQASASSRILRFAELALRVCLGSLGLLSGAASIGYAFNVRADSNNLYGAFSHIILPLVESTDYRVVLICSFTIVWLCLQKSRIGT